MGKYMKITESEKDRIRKLYQGNVQEQEDFDMGEPSENMTITVNIPDEICEFLDERGVPTKDHKRAFEEFIVENEFLGNLFREWFENNFEQGYEWDNQDDVTDHSDEYVDDSDIG